MNYFNYIKKSLPFYLVSGVILALSVCSLIISHGYNKDLHDTLGIIQDTGLKKSLVKKEINKTEALIKYIREDLDVDMTRANPEGLMFRALDEIKANLPNALITVSRFEEKGNKNELPLELEAGMKNYKMVLDYVAYVESFRIPDFEIRHISVSKGQTGGIVLKIEGALLMPAMDTQT